MPRELNNVLSKNRKIPYFIAWKGKKTDVKH